MFSNPDKILPYRFTVAIFVRNVLKIILCFCQVCTGNIDRPIRTNMLSHVVQSVLYGETILVYIHTGLTLINIPSIYLIQIVSKSQTDFTHNKAHSDSESIISTFT